MADPKPKMRGWHRWLLIGSLALNALIISAIVGMVLRGPPSPRGSDAAAAAAPGLAGILRAIPSEHHSKLKREFRENRDEHRDIRRKLGSLRADLATAIEADPFNVDDVRDIMNSHREVTTQIAEGGQEILLNALSEMSAGDREKFAENLRRKRKKGPPKKAPPKGE